MSELLKALKGASDSKSTNGSGAPSTAAQLAEEELEDEIREAFPGADAKKIRKLLKRLRDDDE